ncbi:MAG TPA: Nramp family divalent metal transporter [Acidimicrobiales bacterium]
MTDAAPAVGATSEEAPVRVRARVRDRVSRVLVVVGPGLIAAAAGNDAGGIATYASAGAQFGYRTLWVMMLTAIALVIVQEMCARLGAYTGEGLVSLIREQFPLRLGAFAVVCLIVANLGVVVSEFAGIGAAFEIFGVSRYLTVPLAAVAIWAIVVFGSYRNVERVLLMLALVFITYPIAMVLGHPDWGKVVSQSLLPHLLADKEFLFLVVALIGTTITPYMQLYQAAAVADRGIGPDDYPEERVDSITGSVLAMFISMSIIIATAAAIGGTGPLTSAEEAAEALKPVAGSAAEALFGIGLLGASALAAVVVPLATAYGVAEAAGTERSVSRTFAEAPLFLGLFTGQVAIGAAVALIPGNLIDLLINTQVLNGLITPVFLTFVLILANRRAVLGDAVNGPVLRVVAAVAVLVISVLAFLVFVQNVLGLG